MNNVLKDVLKYCILVQLSFPFIHSHSFTTFLILTVSQDEVSYLPTRSQWLAI